MAGTRWFLLVTLMGVLSVPGSAWASGGPGVHRDVVKLSGRGGPSVDHRLRVAVPAEDPLVEYGFSERGGTVYMARMLAERFTRPARPPLDGIPEDKLAGGVIDLVSTWSPVFYPFRLVFNALETEGEAVLLIREDKAGRVQGGVLEPPQDITSLEVVRPVLVGDELTVHGPPSVAGTYVVGSVSEQGAIGLRDHDAFRKNDARDVHVVIRRRGTIEALWKNGPDATKADPVFVRVDGGGGLPATYLWPDPRHDTSPLFVEKRFDHGEHPYELTLEVVLHNVSPSKVQVQTGLRVSGWQHSGLTEGSMFMEPPDLYAASCFTGDDLERIDYNSLLEEPESFSTETQWVGVDTRYFLVAAAAENLQGAQCAMSGSAQSGVVNATMWAPSVQVIRPWEGGCVPDWLAHHEGKRACSQAAKALGHDLSTPTKTLRATWQSGREDLAGTEREEFDGAWRSLKSRRRAVYQFTLFLGPKDTGLLKVSGHRLDASLDFGILEGIAKIMLWFLGWFYGMFGHWAVAIALLTILVKLVLLPLTNKSFTQMQRMSQLRPQLDELKKEHGDNKEAFAKAQMGLFKREKVNPFGGCLPMLLQMPIWFALYRTIYSSVELYHAPLGLWIHDLSAPDPLYIFPVLLGFTMLGQSYFTPTAAGMDPTQAKMMKYGMPLMFSVFMIALPSGLVLYILINTVLTIIQNLYIRRRIAS